MQRLRARVVLGGVLGALALAPLSMADGPQSAVERIRAEARENSQVMAHLTELCEGIGPRLTGSSKIVEATDWAKARFESYGLEVTTEEWGRWPVIFDRGTSVGAISIDGKVTPATFGTDAWTAGTDGERKGRALLIPETVEELEGLETEGAWIVVGELSNRMRRSWRELREAIEGSGAAGIVMPNRGELIVTGGQVVPYDERPTMPVVQLVESQHSAVLAAMKAGKTVELSFLIENAFKPGPAIHRNVIAELKGSEAPDEVVIVSAHLDSWDGAMGATDNGTGVATTLEAARLIMKAGVKPKRTIRFILWTGEEQGLLGSRAYVQAHRDEMAKVSAVLVHDGGTNAVRGIATTPAQKAQMQAAFGPVINDDHELSFSLREVDGLRGGASDHDSFLAVGVPGYFWDQQGTARYSYTHHTQHDKTDQVIPAYQERSAEVIAIGAWGLANLDAMLSREKLIDMRTRRKVLGVQLDGLTVTAVTPGSIAEQAGFKAGDVILEGGGKTITSMEWLRAAIRNAAGETPFLVQRGEEQVTLKAVFPEAAPARPILGVMLDGMTITQITPGSIAEKAGFKVGDKLLSSDGRQLIMLDELREVIQNASGATPFQVERDGEELRLVADFPEAEPKPTAKPKRFY